jgi:hypothetical protein
MMSEAPHFPELQDDSMRPRTVTSRLAERLAVMADRGLLDIADPQEAANHLFALTFGLLNNRSLFGVRAVSDEDIRRAVTGGVQAFVRAYRTGIPVAGEPAATVVPAAAEPPAARAGTAGSTSADA